MNRSRTYVNTAVIVFYAYTVFLFLLSFSVSMMPSFSIWKPSLLPLNGSIFWIGIIGVGACAVTFCSQCKKAKKKERKRFSNEKIGVLRFFRNKEAFIADILMFAFLVGILIGIVIAAIAPEKPYTLFVFMGMFIFAFGMHCVLNGNNYVYIKKTKERKQ